MVASESFAAVLTAPAAARRFVEGALRSAGLPASEAVAIAVSELVTNSVVHAVSATRVSVLVGERHLRVEVHDDDPTLPAPLHPGPEAIAGRGLLLVEALTDRWGSLPEDGGKIVWFELDR